MKMTNIRKKKIRTPKIFTMSHRLEVTDWKYLKISISLLSLSRKIHIL